MTTYLISSAAMGYGLSPLLSLPQDASTNILMLVRWIHFLAGVTWLGLLYFFNLVNGPLMKELDAPARGKVFPALMSRALLWFRIAAVLTVLAGLAYWGQIVTSDARNAGATSGIAMGSFFGIWTVVWALMYLPLKVGKGPFDNGYILALLYTVILIAAAWLFLALNHHGWESNRMLAIGIGGGFGWVMMLNVWGVIWRIQKRLILWTKESAATGKPMPQEAKAMARMAFLTSRASAFISIPLLFLMGAASHYPMFGG
jgi:uncharacterized membrane protein